MYRGNDSLARMFNQKTSEQTHNLRGDFTPTPVDVNMQTVSLEAPVSGGFNLQPIDMTVDRPDEPTGRPELQYKPLIIDGGGTANLGPAERNEVSSLPAAKPTNKYRNIVIVAIVLLAIYGIYKYSSKKQ